MATEEPVDLLVSRVLKKSTLALDRALAGEVIGYRQWLVLSHIDQTPGINAREIAALLCHDTGALSRIIDVLFGQGLIERDRGTDDKRIVRLTVTADGQVCCRQCRRKIAECRDGWTRQLSPSEQTLMVTAMSKLAAAMDHDR